MDVQALTQFLVHWRNRLQYILSSDPDGFLDRRYPKLAGIISDTFPCYEDLKYYFSPLTKFSAYDSGSLPPVYEVKSSQPSLATLAAFCEHHFGLEHEALVTKMCTTIWEADFPNSFRSSLVIQQPMTKSIHRWVTSMFGHNLDVVKLWYDARQFADIVRSALSASDRSKSKNKDVMYFTITACVVEFARILSDDLLPVASRSLVDSLVVIDLTGVEDRF
ncbi:hypothetical protein BS17DRAFT_817619 [Gyrodon lividus]|nr:hypothetical protein BS17DRAFT_817619 [Gyrodon lividus]